MKTVAVLFGGRSSEYEVSLSSSAGALENIDREKYNVITIGITREGKFYLHKGSIADIRNDTWHKGDVYPLSLDLGDGKFIYTENGVEKSIKPDVILPMMHGKYCEDGTLQGMFAMCEIPVVGCDCGSSAVCMDKAFTKAIVKNETKVRQANAIIVKSGDYTAGDEKLLEKCENEIGYPMFIKPCRAGSSVGVSKVKSRETFFFSLEKALAEDSKVLIEEFIKGREIEVAVLEEHGKYLAAHPAEIDSGSAEFYDYETKYISDASSFYLPARLTVEEQDRVRGYALEIFKALDCRSLSRVDFFYTDDGEFVFNEINTLPGFTPISMYPKMMINEGISYSEAISRLIESV